MCVCVEGRRSGTEKRIYTTSYKTTYLARYEVISLSIDK